MVEKYNHIIWDWNGTIFNDVELSYDIISKMVVEYNLSPITLDQYLEYFTIPVRKYYEKLGFDFEKKSFEIVGREWMDEYERRKFECSLYDGITGVMDRIKKMDIGQSILSAYSQHTLEEMVDHFNLRSYFKHIYGLDNIYAASKLHLGIKLMQLINEDKGKVLLIGDTIHDLEVAAEIGAECILLSSGHQSYSKLKEQSARFGSIPIFNSIDQIFS